MERGGEGGDILGLAGNGDELGLQGGQLEAADQGNAQRARLIVARDEFLGGVREERTNLGGIQLGAGGQKDFGDLRPDRRLAEQSADGLGAGRQLGGLGQRQQFLAGRGAVQRRQDGRQDGCTRLGLQSQSGEQTLLGGQASILPLQRGGDQSRLALEVHAHQEAFELTVVGFADLDRLPVAVRRGRLSQRRLGKRQHGR